MRDKKVIVLGVLGILAVLSLTYGILTPSKLRRKVPASSVQESVQTASPAFENLIPRERHAKRSEAIVWKRDPFLLEEEAAQALAPLALDGIAWDEKEPKAVLNDRIVQVGDSVDAWEVVAIEREKVILTDGERRIELRLGQKK